MNNQTFLITGAHGFIGAWIIKRLLEADARVVIFDRSADPQRLLLIMDAEQVARVQLVTGDITDSDALSPIIDQFGVTNLIHLAGLQVPTCRADPRLGALVNVIGTINVFEAARRAGGQIRQVVYASSAAVFGASEDDRPVNERDEPRPSSHYGVFKRCNEGNAHIYFSITV
jgi:nucleoside-diphosphate-sugar epimerase